MRQKSNKILIEINAIGAKNPVEAEEIKVN